LLRLTNDAVFECGKKCKKKEIRKNYTGVNLFFVADTFCLEVGERVNKINLENL
jgi:hypothetical protein